MYLYYHICTCTIIYVPVLQVDPDHTDPSYPVEVIRAMREALRSICDVSSCCFVVDAFDVANDRPQDSSDGQSLLGPTPVLCYAINDCLCPPGYSCLQHCSAYVCRAKSNLHVP
jgi:hypothetical protein